MAISTMSPASKLESSAPAGTQGCASSPVSVLTLQPDLAPVRRLVVLVPDLELDEVEFARRIWQLASLPHLAVLFLALCRDSSDEPRLRRRLANLAALTRDERIEIETRLRYGSNWKGEVGSVMQSQDVVLCLEGHTAGRRHKPVPELIRSLNLNLWALKGIDMIDPRMHRKPSVEWMFWSVSLTIIAGFLWLQIRAMRISESWAQNALLYLSVPVEIGLLWIWHLIAM